MKLNRLVIILSVIALCSLFLFVYETRAQDSAVGPEEAGNIIVTDITAIIATWATIVGAAGAIFVGFAKYVPGLKDVNAGVISVVVNGLLMVGYWIAEHFNLLPQYMFGLGQIETVGQALLALVAAVVGSGVLHQTSHALNLPVVGYKRHE